MAHTGRTAVERHQGAPQPSTRETSGFLANSDVVVAIDHGDLTGSSIDRPTDAAGLPPLLQDICRNPRRHLETVDHSLQMSCAQQCHERGLALCYLVLDQ